MDHLLLPIPAFDEHGNLPVGDLFDPGATTGLEGCVPCTLGAVHSRFVSAFGSSATRATVWAGWMKHRGDIEQFGLPYSTMVNGSFTSGTEDPGDVDICILYDAIAFNGLPPDVQQHIANALLCGPSAKPAFYCDAYGVPVYPVANPAFSLTVASLNYWIRAFGHDRSKRPKSFLLVPERGVHS